MIKKQAGEHRGVVIAALNGATVPRRFSFGVESMKSHFGSSVGSPMRASKSRMLSLLSTLAALILATGCVGTDQQRSPHYQAWKSVVAKGETGPSLVGSVNRRVIRPTESQLILEALPKNSWGDHDRDVYRVLDTENATRAAPVYPWFEAKPPVAESSE